MVEIIASDNEFPSHDRVWGTGGWVHPDHREALDWLTLCVLLGWTPTVSVVGGRILTSGATQIVIVASPPDELHENSIAALRRRLQDEPLLVIARAGRVNSAFEALAGASMDSRIIQGSSVEWTGPGDHKHWVCGEPLKVSSLKVSSATSTWCTLDGAPIIVARQQGRGTIATLGFHPSQARDTDGVATALLKRLLIWGTPTPIAWLEMSGTLLLRMDDPGGAQNVFSAGWRYRKLCGAEWLAIAADLRCRAARLSIGYITGWKDDGDPGRGQLEVNGIPAERALGRVHPSPIVHYRDLNGLAPGELYDYASEFRGIQKLREAGLGDVEVHGYTHIHPDSSAWAAAPDRYEGRHWYRELGRAARAAIAEQPPEKHPLMQAIVVFEQFFGSRPTTLIPPGDEWTDEVLSKALDLGLQFVSSYYLAVRWEDRFCWTTHVCAPYLNTPDRGWFTSGLPVVGYFHDYEPAIEGTTWLSHWLDQWQAAGANRLIDFRELAGALGRRLHIQSGVMGSRLIITKTSKAVSLVRPLNVNIRVPIGQPPSSLTICHEDKEVSVPVCSLEDGVGAVEVPDVF